LISGADQSAVVALRPPARQDVTFPSSFASYPEIERGAERPERTGLWRRLIPSWTIIVGLAALVRTLAQPTALLNDPDTYLHIAAGRWIITHSALPLHDPFSHSLAGASWVPHEWLAEVVLALVYRIGGWSGLVLMSAACFAVSLALLTRFLLRHYEAFSALIAVISGAALVLGHLLVRPPLLALPLLVIWSGCLFGARDAGRSPPAWLLGVMLLWANLHGSFMFGLALLVFLAAEAVLSPGNRAREAPGWGAFGLLAIIASLMTPNGIAGFVEPFRLALMPALQASFIEWMSPNFQSFQPLEIWLLGIIALGFTTGIRLSVQRLLLLLALCHMALAHARYAELLGLVGPLAVGASLGPQIASRLRAAPLSWLGRGVGRLAAPAKLPAVALALALAAAMSLPVALQPIKLGDDRITPATALAAAGRMGLRGPVFNSEGFGGYLVFSGIPTFIDGRAELYGDGFLSLYLEAESGVEAALTALLEQYGIAWTLQRLDHLSGWHRVYSDDYAVIHIRDP
jgi:hypothetical protein